VNFTLLDSLSLPGNPAKPNDDAFGHSSRAALVMDGATGLCEPLMPGDSDAAWLAQKGAKLLTAFLSAPISPRMALNAVLNQIEYAYVMGRSRAPVATYEKPFASMMAVVADASGFEALFYGDCSGLVKRPGKPVEVLGLAFQARADEASKAAMLAKSKGLNPAAATNLPQFLDALRAARNRVNTEEGHWLFGPDARAADHVKSLRLAAPKGTKLLLMTDGFLALASDYGRYDAEALIEAAQAKGLSAMGDELRDIEAKDPEGVAFPRFKTSDDATALLLELG
jgi:hypothetical protein